MENKYLANAIKASLLTTNANSKWEAFSKLNTNLRHRLDWQLGMADLYFAISTDIPDWIERCYELSNQHYRSFWTIYENIN